jgi:DNA-binding MarR family transcriptional regulator
MIEYKVIKQIEQNTEHTQRTLAAELGVSLGRINYLLAGFSKIGSIQAKSAKAEIRFCSQQLIYAKNVDVADTESKKVKDHHDKIRWRYYLTPRGVKEKFRLAKMYLERLNEEYEMVREDANRG